MASAENKSLGVIIESQCRSIDENNSAVSNYSGTLVEKSSNTFHPAQGLQTNIANQISDCVKLPGQLVYLAKLVSHLYSEVKLYFDQYEKQWTNCYLKKDLKCFTRLIVSTAASADRFGIFDTLQEIAVTAFFVLTYAQTCFF